MPGLHALHVRHKHTAPLSLPHSTYTPSLLKPAFIWLSMLHRPLNLHSRLYPSYSRSLESLVVMSKRVDDPGIYCKPVIFLPPVCFPLRFFTPICASYSSLKSCSQV